MGDALGRTVMHRDRYARRWGLGDRKSPTSETPALVLMEGDPALPLAYAPFRIVDHRIHSYRVERTVSRRLLAS